MYGFAATLTALLWILPPAAVGSDHYGVQVESIRCGRLVVEIGDRSDQLLEACGDPDYREVVELRRSSVKVITPEGGTRLELGIGDLQLVEHWVYKQRSGRLTRVLTVVGGILTDIRLAERN
ncbi:MAG: DUF2845 domain-containing protein [Xanthomonadales bacterium]|nr:DUF2845 domain-containing protein [Xanthomonadales bacterium]